MEDPFNRCYRYPLARLLVSGLVKTPITPDQMIFVQPFLAALAGYFIFFGDAAHLALGALLFETRAILACVKTTLAHERGEIHPAGHAGDAMADWLGAFFLYAGIVWHFHLHPPPLGAWSGYLSVNGVLLLAIFQAAVRSSAADHFKRKYTSILERGRDETVEALRRKLLAVRPEASIFEHIDVFIGRMCYFCFEHKRFEPQRCGSARCDDSLKQLLCDESSTSVRIVGLLWGISNGDAFLSLVVLSLLTNQLWIGQLFFASAGVLWIVAVILLNSWFIRSAPRRSKLAMA
jgi:phosphatidylglycerophosphate synthase